jgi:hypothetical protein
MMARHGLRMMLAALGAVSAAAIGCGGGGGGSCGANVTAEWIVTQNSVVVSCLPGDEVDLNIDDMSATFACAAGAGTTPAVAGGISHNIDLTLFDASNNVLSQTQSMSVFLPCGTITDIGQVEFSLTP